MIGWIIEKIKGLFGPKDFLVDRSNLKAVFPLFSLEEMGWTHVDDALPESDGEYRVIAFPGGMMYEGRTGFSVGDGWEMDACWIKFWKPLDLESK